MLTNHRAAVYLRCSTHDQDTESQRRELLPFVERRGWTLAGEYVDAGVSGAKDRRPALDRLMDDARRGTIDIIVVWALDRFGRSLRHLITSIDELAACRVGFVAVMQGIDTTSESPASTLTLQVLGAVAQFEREMIRARVRAGVAKAKAQGKRLGRPRARLDLAAARARIERGEALRSVARALGTNHATLRRALARDGTETHAPAV
jgi:DNA invertase Pin-like site-specific DNA recombinase